MPIKPEQGIRELEREGCQRVKGGKGGHQKMYNPATNMTTVVPMHKSKDLKNHDWRSIRRQLGLPDFPTK